ncbi:iron-sulfur cluster co-chaperone protein HscB homolog [Ziziphus jujuba]|uniref:Iron-sulfur cluster co-chaperone protein HscB homolog n=2 Tax=Ziziphus jujuba TaxID=326968 RepID=A0A6P4APS1_ZIZJJ|nr:iron-sulfur cluster co-chaperone protein HscB homolog [Ziziphus jujuba]KAH7512272.1 hypothetical protein FEM48_Zijuj12G0072900 [Ziziphus jujuba var. spinosa]
MSKQKLWIPLSSIVRRALRLTQRVPISSAARTQPILASFSPSNSENCGLFPSRGFDFLGSSKLSGRCSLSTQSAEKVVDAKCWNCNAEAEAAPFLVCRSCRCIQPVDQSVDYFRIFGLEKKYDIEDDNLERKYKDWQKKLHPDLVHSKSEREREYAAEQSARVIDAFRTLNKPLSRAIYILKLEGVDVDEEETISEPDLLAEIMEIREAVEEAADSQALKQLQSQMQEKLEHWSNLFAIAFRNRNFGDARKSIRRMTYYERVNEEIVKKL